MKVKKLKFFKSAAVRRSFVAASVLVGGLVSQAHATGIDLTADITAAKTDVTTNGVAVLGVVVSVAVIGWIRRILR